MHKIKFLRGNALPLFAFVGLMVGVLFFAFSKVEIAHIVWYLTLIGGGSPIVWSTVKGMFRGQFAADIVAMLAIITAVLMDQAFAGAIVVLMQSGGEAIEKYGFRRASSSLTALLARAPRTAHRKDDGKIEEIDVGQIKVGDILVVRTGDFIPVDGTIIEGESEIDESSMTGEPLARHKIVGSKVLSGTIDLDGAFNMRADKISEESQYAKIVRLVQAAQAEKAPIQRLADRYAVYFTPLVIVISFLGWVITQDPTTILAVLVVATPCPLILATPIAVLSGINRAAQEGIIFKGGAPLEQIGKIKAALFDKTGTITYGMPFVDQVISFGDTSQEALLYKAACIEQLSSHSVAQAIFRHAKSSGKLEFPKEFREIPGRGAEGVVDHEQIVVGSEPLLEQKLGEGIFEKQQGLIDQTRKEGKLLVFVGIGNQLSGMIVLTDKMRKEVPHMVRRLHSLKIEEIMMITGDNTRNTEVVAKQAGIADFKAELLPEQKVEIVKETEKKYLTMMVGDGINDAPALASATVGVAMGAQGSAISAEAADVVLIVDNVGKIADAVYIGQRMLFIAKQGIWIGIGLSTVLMVIAALGHISPPIGALLQEIIDVAVILNALRAR